MTNGAQIWMKTPELHYFNSPEGSEPIWPYDLLRPQIIILDRSPFPNKNGSQGLSNSKNDKNHHTVSTLCEDLIEMNPLHLTTKI